MNYLNFRCVAERTYGAGVATAIYTKEAVNAVSLMTSLIHAVQRPMHLVLGVDAGAVKTKSSVLWRAAENITRFVFDRSAPVPVHFVPGVSKAWGANVDIDLEFAAFRPAVRVVHGGPAGLLAMTLG